MHICAPSTGPRLSVRCSPLAGSSEQEQSGQEAQGKGGRRSGPAPEAGVQRQRCSVASPQRLEQGPFSTEGASEAPPTAGGLGGVTPLLVLLLLCPSPFPGHCAPWGTHACARLCLQRVRVATPPSPPPLSHLMAVGPCSLAAECPE